MTGIAYISATEEIVKAFLTNFHLDGVAAFKLSEKSPVPPALSANSLRGGRTQGLIVRQITRIDRHPAESDQDCSPECISDSENWLN
jgi:hypothetical protein